MSSAEYTVMLAAVLAAVACALAGTWLVVRRMALMGDAISHAVLPGLIVAFLLGGTRDGLPMFLGASLAGMLAAWAIEWVHRRARVATEASTGLIFTWLFAIGVILLSAYASSVDLDQECVLYGEIALVPLQRWTLTGGTDLGPRALWVLGAAVLINLAFTRLGYKELQLTSFDPTYATVLGISSAVWHYALMGLVSLTSVAAFESVGAILVVALLVAPPATARLLTHRLPRVLLLACALGSSAAVLGYLLARWLDASVAGAMTVVAGAQYALALLWVKAGPAVAAQAPQAQPQQA